MKTIKYRNLDALNNPTWESIKVLEETDITGNITTQIDKITEEAVSSINTEISDIKFNLNTLINNVTEIKEDLREISSKVNEIERVVAVLQEDLYENGTLKISLEKMYSYIISPTAPTEVNKFWIDSTTEGDYILKYYNQEKSTWLPVRIAWGSVAAVPEE